MVVTLAIGAPITEYLRLPESATLYEATAFTCHRLPSRSLFIFTSPMGLCARCFGLYFGFFAAALAVLFLRLKSIGFVLFGLLLLPCFIDGASQYLGFRLSTNPLRFFTGLIAGVGFALFLFPRWISVFLWL